MFSISFCPDHIWVYILFIILKNRYSIFGIESKNTCQENSELLMRA